LVGRLGVQVVEKGEGIIDAIRWNGDLTAQTEAALQLRLKLKLPWEFRHFMHVEEVLDGSNLLGARLKELDRPLVCSPARHSTKRMRATASNRKTEVCDGSQRGVGHAASLGLSRSR
jgi:hypothetical protein